MLFLTHPQPLLFKKKGLFSAKPNTPQEYEKHLFSDEPRSSQREGFGVSQLFLSKPFFQ
jgi:hypothetical protein